MQAVTWGVSTYLGELQSIMCAHRGAAHTQNEGTRDVIYIAFTKCHTDVTAPHFVNKWVGSLNF